jgi:hypothetical protein
MLLFGDTLSKWLSEIKPLEHRIEMRGNAPVRDVGCRCGLGLFGLKEFGLRVSF